MERLRGQAGEGEEGGEEGRDTDKRGDKETEATPVLKMLQGQMS